MKLILSFCIVLLHISNVFCQEWTDEQLEKANTAYDESYLSESEKEAILYINLCRLYPADFAAIELKDYDGLPNVRDKNLAKYKASLAAALATMKPCEPLKPDELLFDDAKCYGNEISKNKRKPHQRIDCMKRNYAECIYFGSGEGMHVAMQWLIDSGVESLGHRKICLSPANRKIAVKINPHFEYRFCAVAEFAK
ncbi:MAG: hypothetical protein QM791_09275 [Ferruginibacter sp.]